MGNPKWVPRFMLGAVLCGVIGSLQAQERLEVNIIYGPIPRPTTVALAKGWYEEELNKVRPVKVNWKYFEFGPPMIAAIASESVDLTTVVGTIPTVVAIERGIDLAIIAPLTGLGRTEGIAARAGISSPADLKGKKIGLPFGTTAHLSTILALKSHGVSPSDVKMTDFRPADLVAAWNRGDLDAGAVWSPFFVQLLEANGREIWTDVDVKEKHGMFIADVMLARGGFMREHPELVEAFVRATIRGYQFQMANPEEAYRITAERLNQPVDLVRTINERYVWPVKLQDMGGSDWIGENFHASLLATGEFLASQGRLPTPLKTDYTPWIEPRFLRKVLGEIDE